MSANPCAETNTIGTTAEALTGSATPESEAVVASALGVWKRYGATQALKDVAIDIRAGEVHALVGRNGCGKSTLVGVLSGVVKQDAGQVFFDNCPAPSSADRGKWRQHVACVYQKPTVVPELSIAENIFLGNLPLRSWGAVKWKEMWAQAESLLSEWGVDVDVKAEASVLTVGERQVVEIVRALLLGTRFVILDEPTAGLEAIEITRLFERVNALREAGVAFLYISHHLDEVFTLSQRVSVLRDGEWVATVDTASINNNDLVSLMVGDEGQSSVPLGVGENVSHRDRAPVLEVRDLTIAGSCHEIEFDVLAGECVGLAGHAGSGSTQVAGAIAGLLRYSQGEIRVKSGRLMQGRPDKAISAGVGYVPEDRYTAGFVPLMSILDNITLPVLDCLGRWGLVPPSAQRKLADKMIRLTGVKLDSPRQDMTQLSGGNQQKVTVGRALSSEPDVLVLVDPTAGIDIASKATILGAVRRIQESGTGVLLVSDDEQDLRICDRVLVMFDGKIFGEFAPGWKESDLVKALEGWGESSE